MIFRQIYSNFGFFSKCVYIFFLEELVQGVEQFSLRQKRNFTFVIFSFIYNLIRNIMTNNIYIKYKLVQKSLKFYELESFLIFWKNFLLMDLKFNPPSKKVFAGAPGLRKRVCLIRICFV